MKHSFLEGVTGFTPMASKHNNSNIAFSSLHATTTAPNTHDRLILISDVSPPRVPPLSSSSAATSEEIVDLRIPVFGEDIEAEALSMGRGVSMGIEVVGDREAERRSSSEAVLIEEEGREGATHNDNNVIVSTGTSGNNNNNGEDEKNTIIGALNIVEEWLDDDGVATDAELFAL